MARWAYADVWRIFREWSPPLPQEQLVAQLQQQLGSSSGDRFKRPVLVSLGDRSETCHTVLEVRALFVRFADLDRFVPVEKMKPHLECGSEYSLGNATSVQGLPDFAASAASWCNSSRVPPEKRVPEQLRGLYWMMELGLPDLSFCTSLAEWNNDTLTAILPEWSTFIFRKESWETVSSLAAGVAKTRYYYYLKFTDSSLSRATITTNYHLFNAAINMPLIELQETPGGQVKSELPGDIFQRPSHVFGRDLGVYYPVRIMYDGGRVHQARYSLMKQMEAQRAVSASLVHYATGC